MIESKTNLQGVSDVIFDDGEISRYVRISREGFSYRVGDSQSDDWISQNKASRSSREIRHRND